MKPMNIVNRAFGQITSGRWIVTVAATYCLIMLTKTLCLLMTEGKVILEASTYIAVVMAILNTVSLVTVFYFQKNRIEGDFAKNNNFQSNSNTASSITTRDI